MNLVKATGTIGGLTLVSRVAGFAREMLMAGSWARAGRRRLFRRLPAAQHLPPLVRRRRLFGRLRAALQPAPPGRGRRVDGQHFSEQVLAVFLPTLVLFTVVFEIIMPRFVAAISGYHGRPSSSSRPR